MHGVIIKAGLSGLTAGFYVAQAGHQGDRSRAISQSLLSAMGTEVCSTSMVRQSPCRTIAHLVYAELWRIDCCDAT